MSAKVIRDGDVVRLATGGPRMTVERVDRTNGTALCAWFIGDELNRLVFRIGALRLAGWARGKVQ